MAPSRAPSARVLRLLRCIELGPNRPFSSSCQRHEEDVVVQRESFYKNPKPETAFVPRLERKLVAAGTPPIGSRRRRMALAHSQGVPFDQLPFQCFQEARKILIEDRKEKLEKIQLMRSRIERLRKTESSGNEVYKEKRLKSMNRELEHLKLLADSNDPNVKRRFEDGLGDMSKPIYRYLANRKWREYAREILLQRITQMRVVPDVVPNCDPIVDIKIRFGRTKVQPGEFVDSAISEHPCQLTIQSYEKEPKLITLAIIDPDVPNFETDRFGSRCHFLATNIRIDPVNPHINLANLSEDQVLLPWLAPTALKGSPYHRLSIAVLQQKDNVPVDKEIALRAIARENFSVRQLMTRHLLQPISASLFRTKWDDNMAAVMARAGMNDADLEMKRTKVRPLPYKRRNPSTFR